MNSGVNKKSEWKKSNSTKYFIIWWIGKYAELCGKIQIKFEFTNFNLPSDLIHYKNYAFVKICITS